MLFTTTLALLSAATTTLATLMMSNVDPASKMTRCRFDMSREHREIAEKHFHAAKSLSSRREDLKTGPVPLYWNVIYENRTYDGGYLSEGAIIAQMDVLNADFKSSGLSFSLENVRYVKNAEWFQNLTQETDMQTTMKKALRQGDASTLNVYSVGLFNDTILGYASFPAYYESLPYHDGVVLKWNSLPNGSATNFDLGKTLTHEAGHWVGLYHTFQGGCDDIDGGDQVADTPAQDTPTFACPNIRDSCKNKLGLDPLHNYMDYSYDSCLTEFSVGQIERLREQMRVFRGVDIII